MSKTPIYVFVGGVILTLAIAATAPKDPSGTYASTTQRTEPLGMMVDMSRCVSATWTAAPDGGYLSRPADAAVDGPQPDAAVWESGADAAVWVQADVGQIGPPAPPEANLRYTCTASTNEACLSQTGYPTSCVGTYRLPKDLQSAPIVFMPSIDGGASLIVGISATGTTIVDCCPLSPVILNGR